MHVAVALLKAGQRVATIDLDSRQKSFTHYIENRRDWAERAPGIKLEIPGIFASRAAAGVRLDEIEAEEFNAFAEAIGAIEHTHDFVVIDTPGHDSYLMRLAHSMADTLVTPLNDSFVDFDVLGTRRPATFAVTGISHYSDMVRERAASAAWSMRPRPTGSWCAIVCRCSARATSGWSARALQELVSALGFRAVDGFAERVVYREFFPRGLTALDDLDEEDAGHAAQHVARHRARGGHGLLESLKLPIDERGRRRAAARAEWFAAPAQPLETAGFSLKRRPHVPLRRSSGGAT